MSELPAGGPRKGLPPIVFILIGLAGLWGLQSQFPKLLGWLPSLPSLPSRPSAPGLNLKLPGGSGEGKNLATAFPLQPNVPAGTTISMDGSTSNLRVSNPGSNVAPEPGSIALLLTGGGALAGIALRRRRNAA